MYATQELDDFMNSRENAASPECMRAAREEINRLEAAEQAQKDRARCPDAETWVRIQTAFRQFSDDTRDCDREVLFSRFCAAMETQNVRVLFLAPPEDPGDYVGVDSFENIARGLRGFLEGTGITPLLIHCAASFPESQVTAFVRHLERLIPGYTFSAVPKVGGIEP